MKPIIEVKNLSKVYNISHVRKPYHTLREDLIEVAKTPIRFLRGHRSDKEEFWALKDVSFDVKQGEVLGIIGRNGAGKSTLLKVLSRITEPTKGSAVLRGRVASLLEVGTGFHPELTGRDNIYLNGALLGMSRKEISRKFDEIVDFAEIEKFLDTPVKFYSSGMYVRLAFAVAAHLEPDILVIDEVLAVGDMQFQQKSLGKMEEISKGGRTVLFVSHNLSAISSLCSRAILLRDGRVASDGAVTLVIKEYMDSGVDTSYQAKPVKVLSKPRIAEVWLETIDGKKVTQLKSGDPFRLVYELDNPTMVPLEIAAAFFDGLRRPLWNFSHAMQGLNTLPTDRRLRVGLEFAPPQLTVSDLIVDLALGPKGGLPYIDHIVDGIRCQVIDNQEKLVLPRYPEWPILCPAIIDYKKVKE